MFDLAIIGGGLAGLSSALLSKNQYQNIIVFEKQAYPFHKVCGEYLSMESWDFLTSICPDILQFKLPIINTMTIIAQNGKSFSASLDLGGIGISRYLLDSTLANQCIKNGIVIADKTKVLHIENSENGYQIDTSNVSYYSKKIYGAWGKKSNLDYQFKRPHIRSKKHNYLAIKYHIKTKFDKNTIALFAFKHGFCGLSAIENDTFCLCYMLPEHLLKKCNGSIQQMESQYLFKNKKLEQIFKESEFVFDNLIAISHINFKNKSKKINQIPLLGDACGNISPLSGNGMSMAMHSAKLLYQSAINDDCLFVKNWNKHFRIRMISSQLLQKIVSTPSLLNMIISLCNTFPSLGKILIKSTHGKVF